MTGPAPRYNMRWDDPGHESERRDLSLLTGRFADPRLEGAFRRQVWHDWSLRVRIVSIVAGLLIASFGYTDYLALGFGPALYLCWGMRALVLAGAAAVARATLGPPRIERLDQSMFALLLVLSFALFAVVGIEQKGLMFEAPGAVLMVLGYYLFVPVRFEIQLASALFVSGGFLAVAAALLEPSEQALLTVAVELLICNALGAFTALRTHVLHRREYLRLRQVQQRARFEELVARLSTRFITVPDDQVGAQIASALGEICDFTGADRAYVYEFDMAAGVSNCVHEWCRDGVPPMMRQGQGLRHDTYSWGMRELLAGREISADRLADLPPAAAPEVRSAELMGARSLLVLPLVFGDRVLGAIGFHAVRRELRWNADRVAVLRMVGEMIVGVLVHRHAAEELAAQKRSLEASVAALERSNTELQHFAYVASHDLQEPLRSISSFSSLLAERYRGRLDEKADEYVSYLRGAATRMHDMITGLLSYSRLDARALPFERCDVRAVIDAALANLRASIDESGATVEILSAPAVDGDPSQLLQLFQNLIGNAIKFHNAEKPHVTVDARWSDTAWEFSVADNGIGVEPRHAERIFQPFTRLHTPEQYPGTGIGLAVCRRIVERHHGRIWVEPNRPHGSVFRFTLPAAP